MTARTRTQLATQITTLLANNTTGDISAADVRSVVEDIVDSLNDLNINIDASAFNGNLSSNDATLDAVAATLDALTVNADADILAHDARPESHENAIIGNIRLHDRNAIPNEDETHQDIRNLLSAHEGTPHGGGGAGITLEQARDAIAAVLVGGTNVTVDYVDDGAGVGSITVNAAGSGLSTEDVRDLIGEVVTAGANVTVTVDDAANTVTITTVAGEGGGLTVAQVLAVVVDWAEQDNTDDIPATKLPAATTGAAGAVELSTNTEAEDSGNNAVVIRPNNLHHVLDAHIALPNAHHTPPDLATHAADANAHHTPPVGEGGGLDQAAVDERVAAGVHDWAETGNSDDIPDGKLPAATVAAPGISEFADIDELDAGTSTARGVSVAGLTHALSNVPGGDPLTLGALPALADLHNARLYGEQETDGEPPDGVYYKKRSMGNEIRVRIDDISSRVPNTIYRAFGWSTVTLAEHYREGGAIHPAKPPALSAVLREYNTETFMWKWVVVTTDAAPFIHTSITLVALNDNGTVRGSTLATETTTLGTFESVERTTTAEDTAMGGINVHETVPFLIRQGGEANTYPLTTENHRARLLDNEDIDSIEGNTHEEVEDLRGHIEPWALTYGDAGQTPGMLEIGGFTQAEIDAIPAGGQADFLYRGRVLKDNDGTLAYVGGGWQERNGALGFVYVTQAEYDALPTSDGKHYYISV